MAEQKPQTSVEDPDVPITSPEGGDEAAEPTQAELPTGLKPSGRLTVEDLRRVTDQVSSEARKLQRESRLQLQIVLGVAAVLLIGVAVAFQKASASIDSSAIAEAGTAAVVDQAKEIANGMGDTGRNKAPEIVGDTENAFLSSVAQYREHLQSTMKDDVAAQVKAALEGSDQAMVEESVMVANAAALVISAQEKPEDAEVLYQEIKQRVTDNDKWLASRMGPAIEELTKTSDHMRKLAEGKGLNLTEHVERRVLQDVVVKAKSSPPSNGAAAGPAVNLDLPTP